MHYMVLVKKRSIKLNEEDEIILSILKKQRRLSSKDIYKKYKQISKISLGFKAFKNRLLKLCSNDLIRSVGEKRWRMYEYFVVDLEDNEIYEHLPEWTRTLKKACLKYFNTRSYIRTREQVEKTSKEQLSISKS